MNTWKVILATLVIFGAGVITGGLLVSHADNINLVPRPGKNPQRQLPAVAANPWMQRARELMRRMDRELNLTPEQHQHIERLIANSADRTRTIWKPIAPQMNKEMQRLHREIREELTSEQRPKFEVISKPRALEKHRFNTNQPPALDTNSPPTNAPPAP